ncbi:3-keto-5-aminohexanoate cleavage protein [Sphingomonas oleivorans]|uniref:3-keto-5-aminohexanoate cleavage protein n=1 Tax=Sphingomonas oleivorans TaxID=1735121 RepID=A0A2T5FZ03_9SPHN|nr:3-keto-5-aminohexanoate cleavage protein [Sphingomonas oleivorans]PTQ11803.1 3-keto-5-aminohexanoate cleavage protein [Sphingomonas oleivorans]
MRRTEKVIITCAVTGSVHTPSMSPHLPITPDEIVDQSVAAAAAGASVLHLHARDPRDGRPTPDPDIFMQFLPRIKQQSDAVINITTGGSNSMTLDERLAAPKRAQPELTSLNMGSMNFDYSQAASRIRDWKFDWEKPYIESSGERIAYNTMGNIERICREIGQAYGTRFEFECYDVGHLYTLAHFADRGLVKPPFFIQCIFGVLGGIGADPENLTHMVRIADKLFGDDWDLSVLAAGRHQMNFVTQSAVMGGNVRVGLEDSLYIGKGRLATSNAEQVAKIGRILRELDLEVATPADARRMLQLKGADAVAF